MKITIAEIRNHKMKTNSKTREIKKNIKDFENELENLAGLNS